jgi:hypothetical protein
MQYPPFQMPTKILPRALIFLARNSPVRLVIDDVSRVHQAASHIEYWSHGCFTAAVRPMISDDAAPEPPRSGTLGCP